MARPMEIPNPKPKKPNMVPKKPISIDSQNCFDHNLCSSFCSSFLSLLCPMLKVNHLTNTPLPMSFSSHRITIPTFKQRREKRTLSYPKKEHYFY